MTSRVTERRVQPYKYRIALRRPPPWSRLPPLHDFEPDSDDSGQPEQRVIGQQAGSRQEWQHLKGSLVAMHMDEDLGLRRPQRQTPRSGSHTHAIAIITRQ